MIIGKTAKGLLDVFQKAIERHQTAIDAHTRSIDNLLKSVRMQSETITLLREDIKRLERPSEYKIEIIPASKAMRLPAPKGYMCAAGCGHHINSHREHGCDELYGTCPCSAPFGRILPNPDA